MFDFIPIKSYIPIYYNIMLVVMLLTAFHCRFLRMEDFRNIAFIQFMGFTLLIFVLLYIGFRPIHGIFVDMTTYAYTYSRFQEGNPINVTGDKGFYAFMDFCAQTIPVESFFALCACIYVIPNYVVSKRLFGTYWFYAFFMILATFTFWAYGTNGIRNGMAASLFLMAMGFEKNKIIMVAILALAASFHSTTYIPIISLIAAYLHPKPKSFLIGWFAAIALSLLFGGFWENLFANLGFDDDRTSYLTSTENAAEFSRTGFRWDFLLYSGTAVLSGWYFIFKRNFNDPFYNVLFCTYLLANSFWILVIRANFSNRFAYLSWFMLGLIIIYPLLKEKLVENQNRWIGGIIFFFYLFTYTLNYLLVKS
ncbi:MAG TPA: EpsG family protein [Catalimonadaceae bacterium]|jgi:hypothetical protein|nr:EpsG family protein [Catalimonadaceae bacterium]